MLSWVVVKREMLKEEEESERRRRVVKEMKKHIIKKPEVHRISKVMELSKEVGWIDAVTTQYVIEVKRSAWKDVHRDIVSTKDPSNISHMYEQ